MTNWPPQETIVWSFLMVTCIHQTMSTRVKVTSQLMTQSPRVLIVAPERSFLSQRQCRLICQQLRKSDSCLEESFSALMHGSGSDGRLCVLKVCAARDTPFDQYSQTKIS